MPGKKGRRVRARIDPPASQKARTAPGRGAFQPLPPILLAVAIAMTYANSLSAPFILDDLFSVVKNPTITRLLSWRVLVPPVPTAVSGRPLPNLSFALNYAIGGLDVVGYHVVNLTFHVVNAILILVLVKWTLERVAESHPLHAAASTIAFVTAFVWGVHPLTTEVVDYVTQRTESMMAAFVLTALLANIRSVRSPNVRTWQAIAVLSTLAAMACKETAVVLPVVVVLYDSTFLFSGFASAIKERWGFYIVLASTLVFEATLVLLYGQSIAGGFETAQISWWQYLLNQPVMIVHYLRLAIWPVGLVLEYGWARPVQLSAVWPYSVICVVLVAATLWLLIRKPMVGFAAAWFLIFLAPSSSVVPIATEVGAERRMYLPLAAVVALIVWAATAVVARLDRPVEKLAPGGRPLTARRRPVTRLMPLTTFVGVTIAFIVMTAVRNRDYRSPVRMARTVVTRWPTPNAEDLLGVALADEGQHAESIVHLRLAVDAVAPARYDLGRELLATGQYSEAVAQFQSFIRLEPRLLATRDAYLFCAKALDLEGRPAQAGEEVQALLSISPGDADAHGILADLLTEQSAFVEAIPHYRVYLGGHPTDGHAWTGLGIALVRSGQPTAAEAAFRKAVEMEPANAQYRQNLARALLEASSPADAAAEAARAVALAASDPAAHVLLGDALAAESKIEGARREYERALQLVPSYPPAVEGLRAILNRAVR